MLPEGGIYQVLIELPAPLELTVGALGPVRLSAGWYVYTGSMRRGLRHRLRRHAAAEKVLRWHIDYLTTAAPVVEVAVWALTGAADQECATHRALLAQPGVSEPVPGFGASDCRCVSHLACLGETAAAWPLPGAQIMSPRSPGPDRWVCGGGGGQDLAGRGTPPPDPLPASGEGASVTQDHPLFLTPPLR